MALAPGSNAGPYRIVEPLGRGGMASVYKAYEPRLDRYVALKVLPREFLHDPGFAQRFREEARLVAKLEHPAIVPIYAYDIEEAEGIPWMAMRLVPGGSLSELIRRERLPLARSVALLRGVADALDYAHAMKVVHRDVKPQNVLLDESSRVYLADFGIGRMLESSGGLTGTGMIVGTPQYMAPEQATTSKVGPPADVYALGIVAYEMFTGRVPFAADTPLAVMMKHVQEPLPLPPPELVPEPLLRALLKATSKKPEDRWPTAGAFVEALAGGLAASASPGTAAAAATATLQAVRPAAPTVVPAETARPVPGTAPPQPPRPPVMRPPARERPAAAAVSRSRGPLLALGGVALVAVLVAAALGIWIARGGSGSPAAESPESPSSASAAPAPAASGVAPALTPSRSAAPGPAEAPSSRPASPPAVQASPALAGPADAAAAPPRPSPGLATPAARPQPAPLVPATAPPPVAAAAPTLPTPAPTAPPTPAAPAVDPDVQRLAAELAANDTATRRRAAQDLAARGPQAVPATQALVVALRDRSPDVRLRAAEALGRVGAAAGAAASEPLAAALRDTDALVSAEAAKALGLMGDAAAPAAGALGQALGHSQVAVRREAARALARVGRRAEPALAALVAALSDKDKTVCSQAARALGRIGAPARGAVPRLTALSRDPDVLVSREAQGALESIGREQP